MYSFFSSSTQPALFVLFEWFVWWEVSGCAAFALWGVTSRIWQLNFSLLLMYGTRPWCLVQAITRHTCPDPHLGSWNCLPHHALIAPYEPMSSIDQQGSSLDSFPTFPPPYPHFNRPSGFWPCVKSSCCQFYCPVFHGFIDELFDLENFSHQH